MLDDVGVVPILINLHHHAEKVREYLKTSGFKNIASTVYEETLLGTGGTLLRNRAFFGQNPLMLVHADNLSRFDIHAFIDSHRTRPPGCEMTMMTFRTPTPESCGIVELDEHGVVQAFHEKVPDPPGNLANGAVYILEPSIFPFLEGLGKNVIDFSTEVLPRYIGRIFTFHNGEFHMDIGTMESYEIANKNKVS
jgi:mannose-1-phosphate guanylyltransferase